MFVRDLLKNEIPYLILSDLVSTAIYFFDHHKLKQIPVLESKYFLGLINEDSLLDASETDTIETLRKHLVQTSINEEQNLFNALNYFSLEKLSILPVINEENRYLGCIHEFDLLVTCCDWLKVKEPGGIIHLEVSNVDYSLSQISQIVEGNGAKILTCLCLPHNSNSKMLEILIKINSEELSGVIQTFERYEYSILASFQKKIQSTGLNDRFDSFIRYLNI
jgi:predicted transcriptional regulator